MRRLLLLPFVLLALSCDQAGPTGPFDATAVEDLAFSSGASGCYTVKFNAQTVATAGGAAGPISGDLTGEFRVYFIPGTTTLEWKGYSLHWTDLGYTLAIDGAPWFGGSDYLEIDGVGPIVYVCHPPDGILPSVGLNECRLNGSTGNATITGVQKANLTLHGYSSRNSLGQFITNTDWNGVICP